MLGRRSFGPASTVRAHPLTVKTRRYFADVRRRVARHANRRRDAPHVPGDLPPQEDHGRFHCGGADGFPITVSFTALDRALTLLDALAKALAKQGFRFEGVEPESRRNRRPEQTGLRAVKDGERFGFRLREGYTRRERSAQELAAAQNAHRYVTAYEMQPNGSLTFELGGQEDGISEVFRDGRKRKLEAELGRIVAAFVDAVPRQKKLRAAKEKAEKERCEAEHRRSVERERVRKEERLVEKLLAEAQRARKFQVLREYLDRLERATLRASGISDEGRKWLEQARALIDSHDPAQVRLRARGHDST